LLSRFTALFQSSIASHKGESALTEHGCTINKVGSAFESTIFDSSSLEFENNSGVGTADLKFIKDSFAVELPLENAVAEAKIDFREFVVEVGQDLPGKI
jgi:hypothetical protein